MDHATAALRTATGAETGADTPVEAKSGGRKAKANMGVNSASLEKIGRGGNVAASHFVFGRERREFDCWCAKSSPPYRSHRVIGFARACVFRWGGGVISCFDVSLYPTVKLTRHVF